MFRRLVLVISTLLFTLIFIGISVCRTYGSGGAVVHPDSLQPMFLAEDSLSSKDLYHQSCINKLSEQLKEEKAGAESLRQIIRYRNEQLWKEGQKRAEVYQLYGFSVAVLLLLAALLYLFYRRSFRRQVADIVQRNKMEQDRLLMVERVRVRMESLDEERERISRNLHDSISNNLVSLGLRLRAMEAGVGQKQELLYMVESTHREIRAIMHNLSSPSLDAMPFEQLFRYHIELMNGKSEFQVEGMLLPEEGWSELHLKFQTELFRVVQEVTGNIVKHSKAARVTITLRRDQDGISLMAEDDGVGMNAGLTAVGFGMKNLKARVEYLGGDIQVSSKPMSGTVVRIFIPTNKVPYTAVAALD